MDELDTLTNTPSPETYKCEVGIVVKNNKDEVQAHTVGYSKEMKKLEFEALGSAIHGAYVAALRRIMGLDEQNKQKEGA